MRESVYFGDRHTAMEMGANIMWLGRRGVVDIAADIAVVVLGGDFRDRDEAGITGDIGALAVSADDLRDVLRTEKVLRLAFAVFAVGIDEEDVRGGSAASFLLRTRTQAGMPVP